MSFYELLPKDYKNHYFSNKIFEIYNYLNVKKHFAKSHNSILIYTIRRNSAKKREEASLCYNMTIQNYEFHGKRFFLYSEALEYMRSFIRGK